MGKIQIRVREGKSLGNY